MIIENSKKFFSIKYALKLLFSYAKALKIVRNSGISDYKTFPNGMS